MASPPMTFQLDDPFFSKVPYSLHHQRRRRRTHGSLPPPLRSESIPAIAGTLSCVSRRNSEEPIAFT